MSHFATCAQYLNTRDCHNTECKQPDCHLASSYVSVCSFTTIILWYECHLLSCICHRHTSRPHSWHVHRT